MTRDSFDKNGEFDLAALVFCEGKSTVLVWILVALKWASINATASVPPLERGLFEVHGNGSENIKEYFFKLTT